MKTLLTPNTELLYRRGFSSDLAQLQQLALLSFEQYADMLSPEHWAKMKANLSNSDRYTELMQTARIFVCAVNEVIVGVAYFIPSGHPTQLFEADWSYIRMVGVNPLYRGRGIAKQLTQMCIDHAVENNERVIALHTSEIMDAARHIYERAGFKRLRDIGKIYGKQYWIYTFDLNQTSADQH